MQTRCQLEDSALALDQLLLEILFPAGIGDIFAEDDDALIAPHLVAQRGVDQVRHSLVRRLVRRGGAFAVRGVFGGGNRRMSFERRRGGIEIGRVHVVVDGFRLRQRGRQRAIGIGLNLLLHFLLDFVDPFFVEDSLAQQKHL